MEYFSSCWIPEVSGWKTVRLGQRWGRSRRKWGLHRGRPNYPRPQRCHRKCTLEWVNWPKKLSNPSNSKQNCMENHPKKYLLEIQRFGSPGFGLKLRCQDPIRPHTHTQLQAKSWRAKPLNFQKIFFGVVPHTILLGIRGCTKFFWSIDPL